MGGPAIFQDAQPPGGDLLLDALVKNDHAVGHVFLQAVARDRIALALFSGDDRGHAAILQPAEEAAQLGAQNGVVRQTGKQRLDRVEHHAFRADRIDGVPDANEKPFVGLPPGS